ncbi:MAG TPA: DUF1801 domain-containing protein [Bacteroidia bacterium]|nr:DUF1801 domain-containing protein [Bacteroidia bacterium]
MILQKQITEYFATLPATKSSEMESLHQLILGLKPNNKLWYLDGKNEAGKVISNPNIGYGTYQLNYADGTSKEFYRIGICATSTGISVYILGFPDKNFLKLNFEKRLGKASVSGYCIKFKKLQDIQLEVLKEAIIKGFELGR